MTASVQSMKLVFCRRNDQTNYINIALMLVDYGLRTRLIMFNWSSQLVCGVSHEQSGLFRVVVRLPLISGDRQSELGFRRRATALQRSPPLDIKKTS